MELDSIKVSEEAIRATEARCNEMIRQAIPVDVKMCKANDPQLNEVGTRSFLGTMLLVYLLMNILLFYSHSRYGTYTKKTTLKLDYSLLTPRPGIPLRESNPILLLFCVATVK